MGILILYGLLDVCLDEFFFLLQLFKQRPTGGYFWRVEGHGQAVVDFGHYASTVLKRARLGWLGV